MLLPLKYSGGGYTAFPSPSTKLLDRYQCSPPPRELCPSPATSTSFFDRSVIYSSASTFITTSGTSTVVYHGPPTMDKQVPLSPRERLRALVVHDAMHTGKVEDDGRVHYILWLCGPAGIGKSAIAKTIADRLDEKDSKAKIVGSFFFFRGDPTRNSLDRFIPSIVYRLAVTIKEVGWEIDRVLEDDPAILDADLAVQWKKLVVETVKAVPNVPPAVIIIDGLDEMWKRKGSEEVTRPQPHIANSITAAPLSTYCRSTIDLAKCKNHTEMKLFIRSEFSRIYTRHKDILEYHLTWPTDDDVDLMTKRADGQFIYPATLFKYIGDDYEDPHERLQACLKQIPEALPPIDALYMQIMQSSHKSDNCKIQDLPFLIITPTLVNTRTNTPFPGPTVHDLAIISGLNIAQCRLKLRRLHSLIQVPNQDHDVISIHHISFADFLLNSKRCGQYHLNRTECTMRVIDTCLSAIEDTKTSEIAPLVVRMQHLDFNQLLWRLRMAIDVTGDKGPSHDLDLDCDYQIFVGIRMAWVGDGHRAKNPRLAEFWENSALIHKFPLHASIVTTIANRLQDFYTRLVEECPLARNVPIKAVGYYNACPLSWEDAFRYRGMVDPPSISHGSIQNKAIR
ncbi:hypothetical protein AX16_004265 [Volvariella volvacea WC 439]|nr:hypothetical protein AX16_004265 [Volvariella volvacea WC 439]